MTRPSRSALIFASLVVLSLWPAQSAAQVGRPGANLTRQEMVERVRRRFEERLSRELELEEEQRDALFEIFRTYGRARAELLPRRMELAREIRGLLAGDRSEDRAVELIQELREIRDEEARLLEEEEDRMLDVLRPTQVLQLQFLRDQFGEQIRMLRSPDSPGNGDTRLRRP